MIILSGLLVIVAIALLVAGIVTEEQGVLGLTGLQLIYVSIAVSVVSFLCLAVGVLIRRKELFGTGPSRPAAPKTRPAGKAARRAAARAEQSGESAPEAEETPYALPMPTAQVPEDALVHVVPGRKRYHLDTCRQLAGRQVEELTYMEAQEEGFSPCTACLPDTALAARATAAAAGGGTDGSDLENGLATEPRIDLDLSRGAEGDRPAAETRAFGSAPSFEDGAFASEGSGDHLAASVPDWSTAPGEPPAAETITDWDPKALMADPVDPLDPAYPVSDDAPAGPSPLEPRRSGDSWSSSAPADPFGAETGADRQPDPDSARGARPSEPSPAETTLIDSVLSESMLSEPLRPADPATDEPAASEPAKTEPTKTEPTRAEPATAESSEHEPTEAETDEPPAAPGPQGGAPAEEAIPAPAVPVSRPSGDDPVVRILSGTKRYHRPDCALIEDIGEGDEDLETLSRGTAEERGCTPCLVCQPDKEPAV